MKKKSLLPAILAVLILVLVIKFGLVDRTGMPQQAGVQPTADPAAATLTLIDPSDAPVSPAPTSEPSETPPPAETPTPDPAPVSDPAPASDPLPTPGPDEETVTEDGRYDTKDEVALYIHTFGHLPSNFVSKSAARKAGWNGGSLEKYFPGCSIGGDVFLNREGLLPRTRGRTYYECDIGTTGKKSRGAKRIIYSNDGLIYYTDDHYDSFTLLYGEDRK